MSVNKFKPHVWVLPEDDANRQLANGFALHSELDPTAIHLCPAAGGWLKAAGAVAAEHADGMRKYPLRHLVLLIDLDGQGDAREQLVRAVFPQDLVDRIYLLSARDDPEALRSSQRQSFERLGELLAKDCALDQPGLWDDEHLRHNKPELSRLIADVKPFLFP